MKFNLSFALLLSFFSISLNAQDSLWTREYQFSMHNQLDLRNSSTNLLSVNRMLQDGFRRGIKSRMPEKIGDISYGVFSFATTYMTMLWSHEFGHSLRAEQVGGHFKIHNAKLPIPHTTMHLPTEVSYQDEALSVTGGFEVNYLTVRKIQREFILQNGTYNEDLSFAFANRLMYPLYTWLIVPIDPKDRDIWIDTAGDPVHCALPVFENYSKVGVFLEDESVNPDLVRFYNQSAIFGTIFNLLDPHFYAEVGGSFGKSSKSRRPKFLLGNYENGWTYGTLFNVSPLGYELYMNNYLHINNRQFSFYAKYGNPFHNIGLGWKWNNMIQRDNFNLSVEIDLWDQSYFETGISTEFEARYNIFDRFDLNLFAGYKTEGYVLGKQINSGFTFGGGLIFQANY